MKERFRAPILYVTHALDEALALGDRACVLAAGKKVAEGAPLDVFGAPRDELVPRLSGFENVLEVQVLEHVPEDELTVAQLGSARLVAPRLDASPGQRVFLGLAASEVVLAAEEPRRLSARNVLPATVSEVLPRGSSLEVRLDVGGAVLVARIVRSAARELEIVAGRSVFVVVKTTAFHRLDLA